MVLVGWGALCFLSSAAKFAAGDYLPAQGIWMVLRKGRKEAIPMCVCPSHACTQLVSQLRGDCKAPWDPPASGTSLNSRLDTGWMGAQTAKPSCLLFEKGDQGCKTHRSWSQSIQTGFPPSPLQSLSQGYEGTSQHVVGTGSHRSCTSTNACTAGTALRCSEGTHPGTCGRTATHTAVRRLLLCLSY